MSTRLDEQEVRRIDQLAGELGLDRGALLKQLIRTGFASLQLERALTSYRTGEISLSRAAEIAGISIRELVLRLPESSVELNYDIDELRRETDRSP